jgi:hypothetical protein
MRILLIIDQQHVIFAITFSSVLVLTKVTDGPASIGYQYIYHRRKEKIERRDSQRHEQSSISFMCNSIRIYVISQP